MGHPKLAGHRAHHDGAHGAIGCGYPSRLHTVFSFLSDESGLCNSRLDSSKRATHRPKLGLAVALGITSHLVLDLLTHARDIAIAPGLDDVKLGLGLYSLFPLGAFFLELLYGMFCWWVYKGGKMLLAVIVVFNVANLSLLSPAVPGPEALLANRPTAIVLLIATQIVVTLFLVGFYSVHPPMDQD